MPVKEISLHTEEKRPMYFVEKVENYWLSHVDFEYIIYIYFIKLYFENI